MAKNVNMIGTGAGMISGISYGFFGVFSSMLLAAGFSDLSLVAIPPLSLVLYFGIRVLMKPHVMKEIPLKVYILMILQGAIGTTVLNYCYTQAYASGMPVGVVSVVAFCNVIVVMVLSVFVLKYKFTLPKVIAVVAAIFGVALVIGLIGGGANAGVYTAMGLMWTLLIPVFYGGNVVITSYGLSKNADSDGILLLAQGASLLVVFIFMIHPIALYQDIFTHAVSAKVILALLGFMLLPHIVCYAMMNEALKRIDPTIYQIMMSLDPVTALILGILIMGQLVAGLQIVGIVIILAAVAFITIMDGREAKAETEITGEADDLPENNN